VPKVQFDSFSFDNGFVDGDQFAYYLDANIEAALIKSYNVDALLGSIALFPYYHTAIIESSKTAHNYLLDAILAYDRNSDVFSESIINAILVSCGKACEELSSEISLLGLRLQLPYATTEDMDLYWSKVLGVKRRFQESDEDYRSRLTVSLTIMKSSGTISDIQNLLDTILGVRNAATIRTYWPAEVRITWNGYSVMRLAESRFGAIREALDNIVIAGVNWSTSFPYKIYSVDAQLSKSISTEYKVDSFVSLDKSTIYRIGVDLFDAGSCSYQVSAGIDMSKRIRYWIDSRIKGTPTHPDLVDAIIAAYHDCTYHVDSILRAISTKIYSVESTVEATKILDYYSLDTIAEKTTKRSYLLSVVIAE